jgi:signal transduction histidine kinase/ActR/RegA family two-component response regulator
VYADAFLHETSGRTLVWLRRAIVPLSLLVFVPGLLFTGEVHVWQLPGTSIVYADPLATPAGNAFFLGIAALFVQTAARFAMAARRGRPRALTHVACMAALALMGLGDGLTAAGVWSVPYLLEVGFLIPAGVIAYELVVRFGQDATILVALRGRLEALVGERTAALEASQRALVRAESLAALGRMAASIAHEVNNPTAAILANLQYLNDALSSGRVPADAVECLRESEQATVRISNIARQLLDSSRLAADQKLDMLAVSVTQAIQQGLRVARPRCPPRLSVLTAVHEPLWVRGQLEAVVQVLVNLVVNAADAIAETERGTYVKVSASRQGERVEIAVEDDGPGMSAAVLGRVFEPFFTTKAVGRGSGLGLAVSRGLLASMGGDLRLESAVGVGTRALIDLQVVEAPVAGEPVPTEALRRPRRNLLLVDDDRRILASLGRVLRSRYAVTCAETIDEALRLIGGNTDFDVVLADVMMSDGGGCELQARLQAGSSPAAARVVFVTAGITDDGVRDYLRRQHQPVLSKPLDLVALEEAVDRVMGTVTTAATA